MVITSEQDDGPPILPRQREKIDAWRQEWLEQWGDELIGGIEPAQCWLLAQDPDSGRAFGLNLATGALRWSPPAEHKLVSMHVQDTASPHPSQRGRARSLPPAPSPRAHTALEGEMGGTPSGAESGRSSFSSWSPLKYVLSRAQRSQSCLDKVQQAPTPSGPSSAVRNLSSWLLHPPSASRHGLGHCRTPSTGAVDVALLSVTPQGTEVSGNSAFKCDSKPQPPGGQSGHRRKFSAGLLDLSPTPTGSLSGAEFDSLLPAASAAKYAAEALAHRAQHGRTPSTGAVDITLLPLTPRGGLEVGGSAESKPEGPGNKHGHRRKFSAGMLDLTPTPTGSFGSVEFESILPMMPLSPKSPSGGLPHSRWLELGDSHSSTADGNDATSTSHSGDALLTPSPRSPLGDPLKSPLGGNALTTSRMANIMPGIFSGTDLGSSLRLERRPEQSPTGCKEACSFQVTIPVEELYAATSPTEIPVSTNPPRLSTAATFIAKGLPLDPSVSNPGMTTTTATSSVLLTSSARVTPSTSKRFPTVNLNPNLDPDVITKTQSSGPALPDARQAIGSDASIMSRSASMPLVTRTINPLCKHERPSFLGFLGIKQRLDDETLISS
ncbi:hypothetical protein CYMTET_11444 [Cymbomonas tetramitiformis]|uniref:Uncharacterized protein n=1 Tax=Cymbomonas tetramitiformis TaxID=36881 RepID=A0AAE0GMN7_9CHLO|nr:hypothetical protein CYMTET_11444 [Cymbomonas tetramitiformis]